MIEFNSKNNRKIKLVEPSMDRLDDVLEFVNTLAEEDTYLSFHPGKKITRKEEEVWLKNNIKAIADKSLFIYWAIYDDSSTSLDQARGGSLGRGKIVGAVDIRRGSSVREWHIGTVGLMVAKVMRGEGLGKFLLESILAKGKEMGIRTAVLGLFSDNEIAKNLYKKVGFIEYGVLPDGVYRKNKFSDHVLMYKRLN